MTKTEAEKAIRHLSHEWAKEKGIADPAGEHRSFSEFATWLERKGYGHYLKFRSAVGSHDDAEMWFDQEMKQTWRR